jgi:hypothetical protein
MRVLNTTAVRDVALRHSKIMKRYSEVDSSMRDFFASLRDARAVVGGDPRTASSLSRTCPGLSF